MVQDTPAKSVNATNGLGSQHHAVLAARERLGRDLDVLNVEMRAEMGHAMEKTLWKVAGTGAAVLAGIVMRNLAMSLWRGIAKNEPPSNPADPATGWGEAIAFTALTGLIVGVARMAASRGAAAGWRKATGTLPPGLQDVA
ncbi:hypothetical protein BH23ACT10_BH23ACT10_00550 [soil metagenome]